jgi:ActR/RegA family two-component response regulator
MQDRRAVLIIDDDVGTRDTLCVALRSNGYHALSAASAEDGIALAETADLALIVLDLRLGDALGTDVISTLRRRGNNVPFLLISGFLTIPTAVHITKLGAVDVLEKPVDIEILLDRIDEIVKAGRAIPGTTIGPAAKASSVAQRWAHHVVNGTESDVDLKTLATWARHVAVSYASLCESCRLVGVRPHDARDFCRLLRAVIRARATGCRPETLLDVSDRRTLRILIDRSGVDWDLGVEEFLNRQRFVDRDSSAFLAVLVLLRQRALLGFDQRRAVDDELGEPHRG